MDDNKELVRRFFEDALDTGDLELLQGLLNDDCVFHRGDLAEPARGKPGVRSIVEKRVKL